MSVTMADLLADLGAETEVVANMVAGLAEDDWNRATPAVGWAIRDQISHLAYFDVAAALAARDPVRFREEANMLFALGDNFPDEVARRYHDMAVDELLNWFRQARRSFIETFMPLDPRMRLPWYGPEMSAASSVTARLMETWAHGQDIADSLDIRREPTSRLRNIAHLGVSTFAFAYMLRGLDVPAASVRVELESPDGGMWTWGPEDAADRVMGSALDFCLVVTQRRHVADTTLRVVGATAVQWMPIAQAFAGRPGPGRQPGQFPTQNGEP